MHLARLPTENLQQALNTSDSRGGDPFHLESLERRTCPWPGGVDAIVDWLPEEALPELLPIFRERNNQHEYRPVVVWYEHLSKAGGTSFCKLAQANMPKISVPSYYCMPSGGKDEADGRVGTWANAELTEYVSQKPHRIVSNEWDPFPSHVLDLQPQTAADLRRGVYNGPKTPSSPIAEPMLILVTSIRNPLDRILSAYNFWGRLHNPAEEKPSFTQWLARIQGRARTYDGMRRRGVVRGGMFRANVGNFNFATWKFSNGTVPLLPRLPEESEEIRLESLSSAPPAEEDWRRPFQLAIETLSQFHLTIPMELLSDHTGTLRNLLGWTTFERDHVVPSGKVINTAALSQLSRAEYDALWSVNWLDMILYHWSRAIFLARIHCADGA